MIPFSKSLQIRNSLVSLILLTLIFVLVSCGENSTNKAKEFMAANMYEQAIALLEQEIQKNPKNADAHLLLGECKLVTGMLSEAQKSFKSATVLNPDLGMKIGKVAISAAKVALREHKHSQSFQIMSLAKKYDPQTSKISSDICIDKAKELFGNELISEGISFLKYSFSHDPSVNKEISDILMSQIIIETQKSKTNSNLDEMISWAIKLDQSKSKDIGQLYYDIGSKIIESSSQSLGEAIKKGFSLAIKYDGSFSSPAAKQLYSFAKDSKQIAVGVEAAYTAGVYDKQLSKKSVELLIDFAQKAYEKGQLKTFKNAFVLAKKLNPGIFTSASERLRCLKALHAYQTGNRVQAIKELKSLSESSNTFAINAALKILSPPKVGIHDVNGYVQWKDLGRPGPMKITLSYYQVTENKQMILNFIAINLAKNRKNKLLYSHGRESEYPYIVDDNGKKQTPINFFKGGRQEKFNSRVKQILFNEGESLELKIIFPLTSEGASKFKFISPKLNGWQWKWTINDINLR